MGTPRCERCGRALRNGKCEPCWIIALQAKVERLKMGIEGALSKHFQREVPKTVCECGACKVLREALAADRQESGDV